jgi:hypothetical protein
MYGNSTGVFNELGWHSDLVVRSSSTRVTLRTDSHRTPAGRQLMVFFLDTLETPTGALHRDVRCPVCQQLHMGDES